MRLIDADVLRQAMYIEAFERDTPLQRWDSGCWIRYKLFEDCLDNVPTIEAFTDEEKRIFLSAMGREEHVCKHVDAVYGDPYCDSLVRICNEIMRKVKNTLWEGDTHA